MNDGPLGADLGNPTDPPVGAPPSNGLDGGEPNDLFAELDEATRAWVGKRHNGDVAALAKQAFELDRFAGNAVAIPKDDAAPEEWTKFYSRLGRPESADKYDLPAPANLPETTPYNAEFATAFREKAFELGIPQKAAAGLHDWFAETTTQMAGNLEGTLATNVAKTIEEANTALQAKWGEPGTETYNTQLELAGRFFDAVDADGSLKTKLANVGLVGPNGEVLVAELAFAFANAGAAIYTEGSTLTEGVGLGGVNPFEGTDEEINLTSIMALVKKDPDQARLMAKAAGKDPKRYGL